MSPDQSVEDESKLQDELSKLPEPVRLRMIEHFMRGHEQEYEATATLQRVQYESIIQSGQDVLKTSILINGGGAIALLALIGNVVGKTAPTWPVHIFVRPLVCFAAGVFASAISMGVGHLAGLSFLHKKEKRGRLFNIVAVSLAVASLVGFALGCYLAAQAFTAFSHSLH
jgi:hypothetical protein